MTRTRSGNGGYDPADYPPFAVTVDLLVFTIRDGEFCLLLVERGAEPYAGRWALPGGFVQVDESPEDAARRELAEEAGITEVDVLEQLATYGDPNRDPRMRVVSVAYLAFVPDLPEPSAGTDAAGARFWPVAGLEQGEPALAFDHADIVRDGIERARAKLEYTPLAAAFCGDEFTIPGLWSVYRAVWGVDADALDQANFQRKVLTSGMVVPADGSRQGPGRGRPARLFRRGEIEVVHPPIRRPAPP